MTVILPDVWYRDLHLQQGLVWHCGYRRAAGGFDARPVSGDCKDRIRRSWLDGLGGVSQQLRDEFLHLKAILGAFFVFRLMLDVPTLCR